MIGYAKEAEAKVNILYVDPSGKYAIRVGSRLKYSTPGKMCPELRQIYSRILKEDAVIQKYISANNVIRIWFEASHGTCFVLEPFDEK